FFWFFCPIAVSRLQSAGSGLRLGSSQVEGRFPARSARFAVPPTADLPPQRIPTIRADGERRVLVDAMRCLSQSPPQDDHRRFAGWLRKTPISASQQQSR